MELNRSIDPTVAGFETEPSACWVQIKPSTCRNPA
ncbi:hypothetical protein SLEP1_g55739 [Rubroshorea leprosula]|uniref:Uncharacterized protein n=1 Tax=Rubroshorea leprosula TaxID=152421 RepID=A0AAV5MGP4_9ROSI|nr:hypothetical protein SLEP1_g55739 [Rubroshorea leprosula]